MQGAANTDVDPAMGLYTMVQGLVRTNMPVWQHQEGSHHLFLSAGRREWVIGFNYDRPADAGVLHTINNGVAARCPNEYNTQGGWSMWHSSAWTVASGVQVTFTSGSHTHLPHLGTHAAYCPAWLLTVCERISGYQKSQKHNAVHNPDSPDVWCPRTLPIILIKLPHV